MVGARWNGVEQARVVRFPNAFPLDLFGIEKYTFPCRRRLELLSFLDPLEGTETNLWSCPGF